MPATPYAKLLVSVDGGGPQSGGIDVSSGATLDFSAESTVGWQQQRWEFYEYPEGWTAPSGWGTADDGTIFSDDKAPDQVTLPDAADIWGVWMVRLKIDGQLDDDVNVIPGLLDEATSLSMPSPQGQRDTGALEIEQFTTATTRHKGIWRSYQRNLRILESGIGARPIAETAISVLLVNITHNTMVATVGGITISLPAAPSNKETFIVKNIAATDITVAGNGHNIDDQAAITLSQWEACTFVYSAASGIWVIV